MIDLGNRRILEDGTVICDQDAMVELLYSGKNLGSVVCSDPRDQKEWIAAARICDSEMPGPIHSDGLPIFDGINWFDHWFTPDEYASLDLRKWCMDRCNSDQERKRTEEELEEFEKREMFPVIKHLIY